jgi:Ni,Fe-hydrogenase III small subunit
LAGGVDSTLHVDFVVRGCPPAPEEILEGLLLLLEAGAA